MPLFQNYSQRIFKTLKGPKPHLHWIGKFFIPGLVQFSSGAQLCPTLCDPMNCSTPGLPVHHQLPEFTQTHVHRVSDAIQPSHPLSSPSPAPNPSQHQQALIPSIRFLSSSEGSSLKCNRVTPSSTFPSPTSILFFRLITMLIS